MAFVHWKPHNHQPKLYNMRLAAVAVLVVTLVTATERAWGGTPTLLLSDATSAGGFAGRQGVQVSMQPRCA